LGETVTGTTSSEALMGSSQDDLIKGGVGADTMTGGNGHDWYEVDSVYDQVIELANGGIDRISLKLADKTVMSYVLPNYVENLTLASVLPQLLVSGNGLNNHIIGSAVNNQLDGLAGNDALVGGAGNDTLTGGAGLDILVGGVGNDSLIGGIGADAFVLDLAGSNTNIDTITDFSVADDDKIYLNLSVFKGLGSSAGALQTNQVVFGGGATESTHRIIYDGATGNLFYDADGTGKVAQIYLVNLSNKASGLSASSFVGYLPSVKDDLSAVIVGVQSADSVIIY
jgi:Ca2+-binding RTX toxin-like protein